jgi:hypothetical protein
LGSRRLALGLGRPSFCAGNSFAPKVSLDSAFLFKVELFDLEKLSK